jgi:Spy/CpxP family protein refolding chaperone
MRTWMALAAFLTLGGVAAAQPDEPNLRARVRDRVRGAVEQKLVNALGLDAATAARFQQVVDRYDGQIVALQRDAAEAHKELKRYLDGGGADAQVINRLADRMLDDRGRVQQLERDRSRDVRAVLTPQQYGRLMVIYPKVALEVKGELWNAMHRGQPPQQQPPY